MRRYITFLTLIVSVWFANAQKSVGHIEFLTESDVPMEVLEKQRSLFPAKLISEWSIHRNNRRTDAENLRYIAKMESDGNTYLKASYHPDGLLLFTESYIPTDNISDIIRLDIDQKHPKFKLAEINLITYGTPERELYSIKLRDHSRIKHVFYDSRGREVARGDLPTAMMLLLL